MVPQRPSTSGPILAVLAILLLPSSYVGAYVAIYDPDAPLMMQADGECRVDHYKYGGQFASFAFAPLEALDWRRRP